MRGEVVSVKTQAQLNTQFRSVCFDDASELTWADLFKEDYTPATLVEAYKRLQYALAQGPTQKYFVASSTYEQLANETIIAQVDMEDITKQFAVTWVKVADGKLPVIPKAQVMTWDNFMAQALSGWGKKVPDSPGERDPFGSSAPHLRDVELASWVEDGRRRTSYKLYAVLERFWFAHLADPLDHFAFEWTVFANETLDRVRENLEKLTEGWDASKERLDEVAANSQKVNGILNILTNGEGTVLSPPHWKDKEGWPSVSCNDFAARGWVQTTKGRKVIADLRRLLSYEHQNPMLSVGCQLFRADTQGVTIPPRLRSYYEARPFPMEGAHVPYLPPFVWMPKRYRLVINEGSGGFDQQHYYSLEHLQTFFDNADNHADNQTRRAALEGLKEQYFFSKRELVLEEARV